MRFSTHKIITIIIGCLVAVCIGTFAPQCASPKLESSFLILGKYPDRSHHGSPVTVSVQALSSRMY